MGKRERHICIRGSSALNSKAGCNAFPLTIERGPSMQLVKKIWDGIDSDGDGRVTASDFRMWLRSTSSSLGPLASSLFSTLDKSRKGYTTFKTLLRVLYPTASKQQLQELAGFACGGQPRREHFAASKHTLEELQAMFRAADTDGGGTLCFQEFLQVMDAAGYAEEEAEDMFAVVDADGSGAIQLDEFTDWYQTMVAKASNAVVDRPPTLLDSLLDWSSSSSSSSSVSSQQDADERLHALDSLSSRSNRREM